MWLPGTASVSAWSAYASSCSSRTSPYAGRVDQQRRRGQRLGRRRVGRELAVDRDHGGLVRPPAQAAVGEHLAGELGVLEHEVPRRVVVARVRVRVGRVVHRLPAFLLGDERCDVRQQLDGRVEQNGAADPLRLARGELEDEPAAERVPDPVGLLDPERVDRLDQVVDVGCERPRRVVPRASVPAEIGRDDVEPRRPALLGEPLVALAVRGRRRARRRRAEPQGRPTRERAVSIGRLFAVPGRRVVRRSLQLVRQIVDLEAARIVVRIDVALAVPELAAVVRAVAQRLRRRKLPCSCTSRVAALMAL